MVNHGSISDIQKILSENGIALKKRFGQNFLTDSNARMRIFSAVRSQWDELSRREGELWEIGPGLGSLTDIFVREELPVHLFEIDHGIISILDRRYEGRIPITAGDFVKTCIPAARAAGPAMITGNLPYASASAIVTRIIEGECSPPAMVFLVQKELAHRFSAPTGNRDYSALSVLVQNHYTTDILFSVSRNAFYPRPEVDSVVIRMRRHRELPTPEETAAASMLARRAFSQRRKAIRNSLKEFSVLLEHCGVDASLRPERIPPELFLKMGRAYLEGAGKDIPTADTP